jgi:type IV pilus assembly protein PilB
MLWELELTPEEVRGRTFFFGKGCDACNNTGYRGRTGLFEIMHLDELARDLILNHASTQVIREEAKKHGMRMLRDTGLMAIYDGATTIEEVVKATVIDA